MEEALRRLGRARRTLAWSVLEVQLAGGERVRVDPQPPSDGFRTVFFAAQLPDGARVGAVIATDGDGRRLERRSAVSRQAGG
ncbi:MAG: hypothetical protein M3524_03835 [Actinomycetota bacterium]|nr:hypothetical protein [Actinomycetota bacterium]